MTHLSLYIRCKTHTALTLFDMDGHDAPPPPPQNVFDYCAQTLWRRKLRLADVTIATSLLGSTRGFLKLSFHMFPYDEIFKVFKSKI